MENNTFQPSPKMLTKLFEYGQQKSFKEGDVILNENAYIKSVPIVISGSMRVMRTDDDGRELLLYYIKSGESCIMSFLGGLHDDTSKVKAIAEEAAEVKRKYNIHDDSQIPDISRFSPVSQVIGLRPGDLCRIYRPSKTAIKAEFYRICFNK